MKTLTRITLFLLSLILLASLVACNKNEGGAWENATYDKDTTFGEGAKTITVVITAEEKTVRFILKTDKRTVGEAMEEHDLISAKNGLIESINGITADWNNGGWWWKYTKNGDMLYIGAYDTIFEDGETYEFTRTTETAW